MLDLTTVKARRAAVTPGKWYAIIYPCGGGSGYPAHGVLQGPRMIQLDKREAYTPEDTELLAAAPTDIDALVQEVERLREALQDAHAMVKEAYKDGALNMYCKTTPPKMGVVSKTIEADWLASDARKRLEGGGA